MTTRSAKPKPGTKPSAKPKAQPKAKAPAAARPLNPAKKLPAARPPTTTKAPAPPRPPSKAKAAEIQALAELEQARHSRLCELLEHTLPRHCDDYLRQLATTAVQVQSIAQIATLQAQLLQERSAASPPEQKKKPAERTASGAKAGSLLSTWLW